MIAPVNFLVEKAEPNSQTPDTTEASKIEVTNVSETAEASESPKNLETGEIPKTAKTSTTSKSSTLSETTKPVKTAKTTKTAKTVQAQESQKTPFPSTLELAAQDVRMVLDQQREQSHALTTKLNILFVTNGALFTSLTISRLLFFPGFFSLAELLGFLLNFTLLINAFLPRQLAVSPNLGDKKFLERYLVLSAEEYQLRMIVNLVETYNANKQRLEDVSSSLQYSAYVTWGLALVITLHVVAVYFVPLIDLSSFG